MRCRRSGSQSCSSRRRATCAVGCDCDRYLEILRREGELPSFSKAEWELLREVLPRIPREPAMSLRGLWRHVQNVDQIDRRAERLKVDVPGLIDRLKALSFVQEVALIERVEELESKGGKGAAPA